MDEEPDDIERRVTEKIGSGDWRRVGGTSAGGYFEVEPRILIAVPTPGHRQSSADARASLAEFQRLVEVEGRPLALVIVVDRVASQDAEGRKMWAETNPERWAGLALVCSSALATAIGSFFVGLRRPSYPLAMFTTIDEAIVWCRQQVNAA